MKDQKFNNESMERLHKENGNKFPSNSSIGGYNISYIDNRANLLCSTCANKDENIESIAESFIFWEGALSYCEECNNAIESEYGNPFADEEESENE